MITNVFLLVIVILLSFLCIQSRRMSVTLSRSLSILVNLRHLLLTSTTKKSTSMKRKKSQTCETSSVPDSSLTSIPSTLVSEPSEQNETLPSLQPDKFFDTVFPAHCSCCKDCISSLSGTRLCYNTKCEYYSLMLNQIKS